MSKDTATEQPVEESLEDSISAVLDAADEPDEEESEAKEEQPEITEEEPEKDSETTKEVAEVEEEEPDELAATDEDEPSDDLDDSETEQGDGLEAPIHWAVNDRELFNKQPPDAQEWLLERHRSMEGDYTKKSQNIAATQRQFDAIQDALSPYEAEFSQAGLDHAGAVRKLAAVHQALKTDGKSAIMNLANTYGIDLNEADQEYADPALRQTQSQLSAIEQRIARQEQAAQQEQQNALLDSIKTFETEKDDTGKLRHPHFKVLQDDITALFNAGLAKDLGEGYTKALSMRPDLAVVKTASKVNQAEKVAKAKKAATGIKSSGAVGKSPAKAMSLEDEIASQIP